MTEYFSLSVSSTIINLGKNNYCHRTDPCILSVYLAQFNALNTVTSIVGALLLLFLR